MRSYDRHTMFGKGPLPSEDEDMWFPMLIMRRYTFYKWKGEGPYQFIEG